MLRVGFDFEHRFRKAYVHDVLKRNKMTISVAYGGSQKKSKVPGTNNAGRFVIGN